uniref:THAP domain-containing protein 1 n=1 Tax=Dicentrarchus labrax TaxID=13489 RepID=A0A8C4HIU4_DICLA
MGKSCCAIDCTNRSSEGSEQSFYRLPKAAEKRRLWIAAIWRDSWYPGTETWICGSHFVSGKKSDDPLHPDYVPSLFSFTSTADRTRAVNHLERYVLYAFRLCHVYLPGSLASGGAVSNIFV